MGSESGAQALHHGAGVGAPSEVPLLPRVLSLLRAALGREGPRTTGAQALLGESEHRQPPTPERCCFRGTRPPPTPTTAPPVRGRPVRGPRATRSPASTRNSSADQPLSCPLKADSGTLRGAEQQPRLGSPRTRVSERAGPGRAEPQVSGQCGALGVAVRGSGGVALPSARCRLSTLSGPRVCQDCCRGGSGPRLWRSSPQDVGSRAWLCLRAPFPRGSTAARGGGPGRRPAFSPASRLLCNLPLCPGCVGFQDTRL